MSLPDIRLQIAAVTLAEELSFTRAADRLKITQPALSKQIAELENRVGFAVFKRDQKRVELTDAGQVFVRGCRDSLAILEKAVRLARSAQDEIQPVVTIGHSPYVDPGIISSILSVHLPLYPNLRLRMESMFAGELTHSVIAAELDMAIVAEAPDNPLLTRVSLDQTPLYVLLSADHPAAGRRSIAMSELGGVGWMVFSKKANPPIYERLFEAAKRANVAPVELHHYVAPQEVVQLITQNFGVAFMPKGIAEQFDSRDLVARPLNDGHLTITNFLVLQADQSSRLINEFGRALLKKLVPNAKDMDTSGQLFLKL